MMERERPAHGGYPQPDSVKTLLEIMPCEEWYAIEKAARCRDEERADFYRRRANYA